eukprot:s3056_g3.t1
MTLEAWCSQCAHFTARIGHTHTADEKAALQLAQQIHLTNVKAYRTLQGRLATLSEQSTLGPDSTESCLMIAIDGLDQQKTRWPRNMSSSKCLDNLWRPQCHLIGYICYGVTQCCQLETGSIPPVSVPTCKSPRNLQFLCLLPILVAKVCEGFFVVDSDVPQDSSCELTVLEKILDWCHDILCQRNCSMPAHLESAYTPKPHDVIMLAKELVNSNQLSQRPLVVLPEDFMAKLTKPLEPMERNTIPERARKEPKKRAAPNPAGEPKRRGRPPKVKNTADPPAAEALGAHAKSKAKPPADAQVAPGVGEGNSGLGEVPGVMENGEGSLGEEEAVVLDGGDGAERGDGADGAEGDGADAGRDAHEDGGSFGCPRCYFSPNGCSTCRRPGYRPRKPKSTTPGTARELKPKAKAKAKAAAKSKVYKKPGRGRKPGKATRVKS